MMILSAVILLIGFVALAGMMGRVNQLGTQTSTENDQTLLKEVGPMADSLETAISALRGSRTVTACWHSGDDDVYIPSTATTSAFFPQDVDRHVTVGTTTNVGIVGSYESASRIKLTGLALSTGASSTAACTAIGASFREGTLTFNQVTASATASTVGCEATASCVSTITVTTPAAGFFEAGASSSDIGQRITAAGLPPGAYILASPTPTATSVRISCPVACTLLTDVVMTVGDFGLSDTTTPTIQSAVASVLETMSALAASHGLLMDYVVTCGAEATVEVWLSDGTLQVSIRPRATFPAPAVGTADPFC